MIRKDNDMDESKTVPELLRELAAAEHSVDLAEMFDGLADRVEREYIERPRFEDGAVVEVGDMVLWNDCESKRVEGIHVEVHLEGACGTYNSVLKRPKPEVLDADGVPIKVGDTVYSKIDPDQPIKVTRIDDDGWIVCDGGAHFIPHPDNLTHRQPDTMERIEADARLSAFYYWGCCDFRCEECPALIDGKTPEDHYHVNSCEYAMILDLLRRQRNVLERGQA